MNLFAELKRRNVFRMAALYAVAGWLIMQVAEVLMALAGLPLWTGQALLAVLAIGFPIALIFSWFYELTPEGLSLEKDIEAHESITHVTGQRINYLVISLLCAGLVVFAIDKWWLREAPEPADAAAPAAYANSVAVLAFDDLSPDGDQGWFSDGLSEEIINSLTRLPELKVTARTSAFHFKGLNVPIPEIAATLGVAHVVEGSVRRAGDQMRVTAQLIKADDGFHLWSETYDRPTDDVFAVQEDIATNIATALDVYLDEERREKMFQTGTRNVQAYEAYLRGAETSRKWHGTHAEGLIWEAQRWFADALEHDPGFALAQFLHGDAYYHYGNGLTDSPPDSGLTPEAALELLLQDYDRAIELAPSEELRVTFQVERTLMSDDWSRLRSLLDKLGTIRESSTNSVIRALDIDSYVAFVLLGRSGIESNYRHFKRSLDVYPMDWWVMDGAIASALYLGKHEEVQELLEQVERIHGSAAAAYFRRYVWFETGHYKELLADPDTRPADRALALIVTGRHDEARALIHERLANAEGPDYRLAWAQQLLGETDYAEEMYRTLDARPVYSNTILSVWLYFWNGRLTWDLDWTPNFAARLAELGVELEQYEFAPLADQP